MVIPFSVDPASSFIFNNLSALAYTIALFRSFFFKMLPALARERLGVRNGHPVPRDFGGNWGGNVGS